MSIYLVQIGLMLLAGQSCQVSTLGFPAWYDKCFSTRYKCLNTIKWMGDFKEKEVLACLESKYK